jgi:hypothetical protein
VSAREEFPALPGDAEGGMIPLLAAESGPVAFDPVESAGFVVFADGPLQELIIIIMAKIETTDIFFI